MIFLIYIYDIPPLPPKTDKTEAPPGSPAFPPGAVLQSKEAEAVDLVPTGDSTVPYFPKTIHLPANGSSSSSTASAALPAGVGSPAEEEYQLLGLGTRKVSFLSIRVYVVGLYVASDDIARLQSRLIRQGAEVEGASTLVAGERERLRSRLLDAEGSEEVWDEVLKKSGVRSILRIVPVRNTDFAHLRDGWLRGVTARSTGTGSSSSSKLAEEQKFDDEEFGAAVGQFKQLFSGAGRKSVGKGKVLMLGREVDGVLSAWIQDEKAKDGFAKMGDVLDERLSRLIWLGYLGGKNVASEEAREKVVDGIMEIVGRPVGTVETQVV